MKTLIKVLVVGLLSLGSTIWASAKPTDEIATTAAHEVKVNNLFFLKTQKKFIGAKVEIFQANGELLTEQNLEKRKVIIDFGSVKYGTYTIRVTKGGETQEFRFVKK